MKYKAKYSAESDIPTDVKFLYVMQNGEWVFNGTEFDGLAGMLNPGLEANKTAILEEKRVAVLAKDAAEKRVGDLESELGKLKKPGTVIINSDDEKLFNEYKQLGPVKDVKAKLDNEVEVSSKLAAYDTEKEVRGLAKKLGLNEDALVDFKLNSTRGQNLKLGTVKVKQKDRRGTEVEVEVPAVITTDTVNNKEVEKAVALSDYAKDQNFPQYLVDAIFSSDQKGSSSSSRREEPRSTFTVPTSVKKPTGSTESGEKSMLDKKLGAFNAERSTRKMPWDKSTTTSEK